ncbi:putative tellurium resistance membrane protein TerC [Limnobacter thiooxidans]|uniref:TerC family protein n=1 Tax=Limnobacter thiooxidans TaxID=131080 RepID=A0AA86IYN5_9BURK|nr:TerC family protein [Limnobacter sp.]MCZ8016367.1 TerC family protein [Limnobacter sp.]RZS39771.1 putative tellurium resistance membrane protein TerC [Limnobacter thiooxidans]BET24601.1 TerC family protein [Limnobacter thiooxidans]
MELLMDPNVWIAFAILTALEIVLGIDNIVFITVLVSKLPADIRDRVRQFGLMFAMVTRVGLLFSLSWIIGLTEPLFEVMGASITGRDLVLFFGGLFLLYKASKEIYEEVEAPQKHEDELALGAAAQQTGKKLFIYSIIQIGILDIVFSLDSVITAVGMADDIEVMIAAVMVAVGVMMVFAKSIGEFVEAHTSVKVLALAFLMMVGMLLIAESFGQHVPKAYLYSAMGFSLLVELLNLRSKAKRQRLLDEAAQAKA